MASFVMLVNQWRYPIIMAHRMRDHPADNTLGTYLKGRREKLDPAAFGYPTGRRRTPGLRREEVAQRANISPAWYTWLEQGRGGAPSPDVLDRIARALMLTEIEREHLFLLGLGHPPESRFSAASGVTPRLQRVLDALDPCPAIIRTAIWDVIAWNRGACAMLIDYASLPPHERNVLRYIFLDPRAHAAMANWEDVARFALGAFRADTARAGAGNEIVPFVAELSRLSADFKAMWETNEVRGSPGETIKHLRHPRFGALTFEYSTFAVDGRSDLNMVVYSPVTADGGQRVDLALD